MSARNILTPDELIELTGFQRKSYQVRALRSMGIDHVVRPDGSPVVFAAALRREGKAVGGGATEPNWDAI